MNDFKLRLEFQELLESCALDAFRIEDGILLEFHGFANEFTIPEGVTEIGCGAFSNHNNLETVTLPSSLKTINSFAFSECRNLKEIIFSDSLVEIHCKAFFNCEKLNNVVLPHSLQKIEDYAFANCNNLSDIKINSSIQEIGEHAFRNCRINNLETDFFTIENGLCLSKDKKTLFCSSDIGIKNVIIPESVTCIAEGTFSGNTELEAITIPSRFTKIPDHTFSFCRKLKQVNLPESILEIGEYSFSDCSNLESITLPSSLKKIGVLAFYGCNKLKSVEIPHSVQEIKEFAFQNCMIDNLKTDFFTIEDGICYNPEKTEVLYYADGSRTKIQLPSTVKTIGYASFVYFYNLTEIQFPDSLVEIKAEAFEECGFTSITIPSSVNIIRNGAFFNCKKLRNVIFKSNKSCLEKDAFACFELNKKSIKEIEMHTIK